MSGIERFVRRWSRLKRQPAVGSTAKELPSLETLASDADLSAYLGLEVNESLRRQALKRIFSDPGFNIMDGLDVYIDDYSLADPIPAEVLAQMNQARSLFADDGFSEKDGITTNRAGTMANAENPIAETADRLEKISCPAKQRSDADNPQKGWA